MHLEAHLPSSSRTITTLGFGPFDELLKLYVYAEKVTPTCRTQTHCTSQRICQQIMMRAFAEVAETSYSEKRMGRTQQVRQTKLELK